MTKSSPESPRERKKIDLKTTTVVLTEAGYRCGVPRCRGILAIDMHHLWEVNAGGGDGPDNLIALCPTCHALYHRGVIRKDSIYAYKALLVAMGRAFDVDAIDLLKFVGMYAVVPLGGDGIVPFARLIAAGFVKGQASWGSYPNNNSVSWQVTLTDRGRLLLDAWEAGDRVALQAALAPGVTAPTDY